MDRNFFYALMHGDGTTDYELYLNTRSLLSCQKAFHELCNGDELQFQIVHQIEELLMKLINYTLLDIVDYLKAGETQRILTLFKRIRLLQEPMMHLFSLLDTMSPREYQEIRVGLGNGSGQESPGFRTLVKLAPLLWEAFKSRYLDGAGLSLRQVYDFEYCHDDSYAVAEALADYDALFQKFRYHHLQHIKRSIGLGSKSLKGRPVELLEAGLTHPFFPELWEVRNRMTDEWAQTHGEVRKSLGSQGGRAPGSEEPASGPSRGPVNE